MNKIVCTMGADFPTNLLEAGKIVIINLCTCLILKWNFGKLLKFKNEFRNIKFLRPFKFFGICWYPFCIWSLCPLGNFCVSQIEEWRWEIVIIECKRSAVKPYNDDLILTVSYNTYFDWYVMHCWEGNHHHHSW